MENYHDLIKEILAKGQNFKDRTGIGTKSLFGKSLKWDLADGFPAVTAKKLAWKSVVSELLWFLEGSTSIYRLSQLLHGNKNGKTIWNDNYENQAIEIGYSNGNLGLIYGAQWRDFNGVDQIKLLIESLKNELKSGLKK